MTEMEKELNRTEASRGSWAGVRFPYLVTPETDHGQNAALQAQGEAAIKKLKVSIRHSTAHVRPILQYYTPLSTRMTLRYWTRA